MDGELVVASNGSHVRFLYALGVFHSARLMYARYQSPFYSVNAKK
jgi:hypothetical protein